MHKRKQKRIKTFHYDKKQTQMESVMEKIRNNNNKNTKHI